MDGYSNKLPKNQVNILTILFFRASSEEMRNNAASMSAPNVGPNKPNSMNSSLVSNAQPMSFTGAPAFDSNV